MREVSFDFGKKPVTEGYVKVTGETLFKNDAEYGLLRTAEAVEREVGEKELNRDFLLLPDNKFFVKLENGEYIVRVSTGDYVDEGDNTVKYIVNGVEGSAWVYDGCVIEKYLYVNVTDGIMEFDFAKSRHTAVNSINIAMVQDLPAPEVTAEITAEKDEQQVRLTWKPVESVYAYYVKRFNKQNGEFDRHDMVVTEEYTDKDVDLAEKYSYSVYCLYSHHFTARKRTTVEVVIEDGTGVTGEVSDLDAKETPNTVALTWNGTENAAWYNVYQKAPYGLYKLIAKTKKTEYIHDHVVTNVPFVYAVEAVTPGGVSNRIETTIDMEAKPFRRKMETLGRGGVAMKTKDGVFLSWRLNAWEYEQGINFVLDRNGEKIAYVTDSTNYLDKEGTAKDIYRIRAVKDGKAEKHGQEVKVVDAPYISIPLDKPAPVTLRDGKTYSYTANDAAVGDVDGDGEYEIILRWDCNPKDNSKKGFTGNVLLDAYKITGEKLWRIDLGRNIRSGQHYTQMMVYDFDSDGKAELVVKTADGTVDGTGKVIGDANADYVNDDGFILEGPEFLTLFDGETGAELDTVPYDPPRGNVADWGDSWGNRVDRFLACVAYLDGVNPSVVMCRGYYDHGRPTNLVAYDVIDKKLVKRWKFRADKDKNIEYTYQGNHNLGVGDVDGDGKDEIVYGAMAVDDDGTGMYSTRLCHGDTLNLGNFTPETPNLDFFQIHEESFAKYGFESRDPATGEIKWGRWTGRDTTRGLCAKVDPRYPGNQCWAMDDGIYTMDGKLINKEGPKSIDFAIWWDGDLLRELLDHEFDDELGAGYPKIYKWDYENNKLVTILDAAGTLSNNWKKGHPCIQADILGDWREEAVWRSADDTELRIYVSTELTNHKFYTLMHDSLYRCSVAFQNTAYNQCTQTSFYIGPDMKGMPPVPSNEYVNGEPMPDFTEDID